MKKCARSIVYPQHTLRPWSTRSHHAFGLPKLHRCFEYASVTVRVFRSEDLKKLSSFTIFSMTSTTSPTTPILFLAAGSLWLCGSITSLSTEMFSMPFFCYWQIRMLGGGQSVSSTCCYLLQVVRASPMFTFCFSRDVCSFWSFFLIFLLMIPPD